MHWTKSWANWLKLSSQKKAAQQYWVKFRLVMFWREWQMNSALITRSFNWLPWPLNLMSEPSKESSWDLKTSEIQRSLFKLKLITKTLKANKASKMWFFNWQKSEKNWFSIWLKWEKQLPKEPRKKYLLKKQEINWMLTYHWPSKFWLTLEMKRNH